MNLVVLDNVICPITGYPINEERHSRRIWRRDNPLGDVIFISERVRIETDPLMLFFKSGLIALKEWLDSDEENGYSESLGR